jgi:hypothetical protein
MAGFEVFTEDSDFSDAGEFLWGKGTRMDEMRAA